jgi:hypothetical protein
MLRLRLSAFRHLWFGLCGGILVGIPIGYAIADHPGRQFFVSVVAPILLCVAYLPDLAIRFIRGIRLFRSAAKPHPLKQDRL